MNGPLINQLTNSGNYGSINSNMGGSNDDYVKANVDEPDESQEDHKSQDDGSSFSYFHMYKYSTLGERVLIFFAIIASLIAGLGMPLMGIIVGDCLDLMVDFEITKNGRFSDNNVTAYEHIYKNVTGDEFSAELRIICGQIAILGALTFVLVMFIVWTMSYTAENQMYRIRSLFINSIMRQDIGWFDTNATGDFTSKVGENMTKVNNGINEKVALTCYAFATFLGCIISAFIIGWKLTLAILSVMPFIVVSITLITKIQLNFASLEMKAYGIAGSIAEEILGAFRTVVAFGGEQKEVQRYSKNLLQAKDSGLKRATASAAALAVYNLFNFIAYAIGFWYGAKLVFESRIDGNIEYTAGTVLKVFTNVLMGTLFLGSVGPYLEVFSVAAASARDVFDIIELEPTIDSSSTSGKIISDMTGSISFNDVHFSYPSRKDSPILQGISFEVKKGETAALVGSSGCGKSTITHLIQRFYDVDKGSVHIDGVDIRDLNVGWLRENIGLVGQEPMLFANTIYENIKLGKDVPDKEMIKATTSSNVHNFIMGLPNKYETVVGSKGSQMSGGQKQRIAIARALVRDPKILLLDEATSALDTESESLVQSALDKASEGRTTLIIAHRLSTVRNADRIMVIGDGTLLEQGTHQELLDKKGQYYQLVSLQMDTSADFDNESEVNKLSKTHSHRLSVGSTSSKLELKDLDNEEDNDDVDKIMKNIVWKTLKMNSPEKAYIYFGLFMSVIFGSTFTVYAYFYGAVLGLFQLEDYEEAKRQSLILGGIFIAIGIISAIVSFLQLFMFAVSGEKLTMRLRLMSFTAIMKQEVSWHDRKENSVGALCTLLSADAANVQGATGVRVGSLLQGVATMGSAIIMSLILNWQLTLILYLSVPLLLYASYIEGKSIIDQSLLHQSSTDEANNLAVEALDNIRTVASLHREEKFCQKFINYFNAPLRIAIRNSFLRALMLSFSQAMPFFIYAIGLVYGGHLMKTKGLHYADLFKVLEAVIMGSYATAQAFAYSSDYQKAKVSSSRIIRLIRRVPEINITDDSGVILDNFKGEVSFKDVRFIYPTRPDVTVLHDVNLKVKPGMTVALVGTSGCGKSTCVQLMQRFYDTDFGDIMMDSVSNKELNLKWLRSQIGLVQQEPILFDYSIAENIAYGKLGHDVPMDQIIKVAKDANIHKFITELPQGYETSVGSRGSQLSGGQKQRVAIARALIRNPKLLLLDEATSALDSESEKIVEEALEKARHGRSCIVIAHRLSTIQNADCIVAMRNGKVVELGTHQELLKQRGFYYLLHQKQSCSMINN